MQSLRLYDHNGMYEYPFWPFTITLIFSEIGADIMDLADDQRRELIMQE